MRIIWAFLPVKRFMADTENICYVDARIGALGGKMKKIYALLLCILFSFTIISCASVPSTSRERVLSISGYSISETDFGGVERWYAVDKYNYDSLIDEVRFQVGYFKNNKG